MFAPLLLMLDLSGKRRTDRRLVELAELVSQMSFARVGAVAASFGLPGSAGRAHSAVADVAPLLTEVGQQGVAGAPTGADVVIVDGTGMRASSRRLGVNCSIALGLTARHGRLRRQHAEHRVAQPALAQSWAAMVDQLRDLRPPAVVVVDVEKAS